MHTSIAIAIGIHFSLQDVRKDVIGESGDVLQWVTCINDQFVACYMQDVKEVMYLYDMKGTQLLKFPLPAAGNQFHCVTADMFDRYHC
jgi:prolyl oligopeptidase PreP (S9A serine peptidase family)